MAFLLFVSGRVTSIGLSGKTPAERHRDAFERAASRTYPKTCMAMARLGRLHTIFVHAAPTQPSEQCQSTSGRDLVQDREAASSAGCSSSPRSDAQARRPAVVGSCVRGSRPSHHPLRRPAGRAPAHARPPAPHRIDATVTADGARAARETRRHRAEHGRLPNSLYAERRQSSLAGCSDSSSASSPIRWR